MNILQKERSRHHISIKAAHEGIHYAFSTQPNFLYHLFFSTLAILGGLLLGISKIEWLIIIFTIITGFVIEMANTAVESVVDLVTDQWHKDAKIAKDVAAGMMLLYAYGAVILAGIIFIPRVVDLVLSLMVAK
jgi:diacylglycerol kinase